MDDWDYWDYCAALRGYKFRSIDPPSGGGVKTAYGSCAAAVKRLDS